MHAEPQLNIPTRRPKNQTAINETLQLTTPRNKI